MISFGGFLFAFNNLYMYYDSEVRKKTEIVPHKFKTMGEKKFGS